MKRYKLEFGGMFMYYWGKNIGEALATMIKDRPNYLHDLESITEEPLKDYEKP